MAATKLEHAHRGRAPALVGALAETAAHIRPSRAVPRTRKGRCELANNDDASSGRSWSRRRPQGNGRRHREFLAVLELCDFSGLRTALQRIDRPGWRSGRPHGRTDAALSAGKPLDGRMARA